MSDEVTSPAAAPRRRLWDDLVSLGGATVLLAVAVATVVMAHLSGGDLALTLSPLIVAAVLFAFWIAPLRWTQALLVFLVLGLDDDTAASGYWHTPWSIVKQVLIYNVDRVFPAAQGFKLSGMEMIAILGLIVAGLRRARRSDIDSRGRVQCASVLVEAVLAGALSVGWAVYNGLSRGGSAEIAIWQARPLLHILGLFLFFNIGLRGRGDRMAMGRIVVAAAIAKAVLAVYIHFLYVDAADRPAFATSHGDSFLFALAFVAVLVDLMERSKWRRLPLASLLLSVLMLGMWANNRRLAWVQVAFSLVAMYILTPWSAWKRAVTRSVLVLAPVIALYMAVGWNSPRGFFVPVRVLRTVADTKGDRSTYFRWVENYNLVVGMQFTPLRGRGFGNEFVEFFTLDDVTQYFPQYHAEPHNQVLGLLFFGGIFTFAAFWCMSGLGFFLAARSYRFADRPEDRAAALTCFAGLLIGLVDSYGDLGPYWFQHRLLLPLMLVLVGKLAVSTGAWPAHQRRHAVQSAFAAWAAGASAQRRRNVSSSSPTAAQE